MPRKPKPSSNLSARIELRLTAKEKAVFQDAAKRQGIGLSQWLRLAAYQVISDHDGRVKLITLDE